MAGSFVELLGKGRAPRAQVTWIALGAEGEPREKLQKIRFPNFPRTFHAHPLELSTHFPRPYPNTHHQTFTALSTPT